MTTQPTTPTTTPIPMIALHLEGGELRNFPIAKLTPCGKGGVIKTGGGWRAVHRDFTSNDGTATGASVAPHLFLFPLQREAARFAEVFSAMVAEGVPAYDAARQALNAACEVTGN